MDWGGGGGGPSLKDMSPKKSSFFLYALPKRVDKIYTYRYYFITFKEAYFHHQHKELYFFPK